MSTSSQIDQLLTRIRKHMGVLEQLRPLNMKLEHPKNLARSAVFDLKVADLIVIEEALAFESEMILHPRVRDAVNEVWDSKR